MTKEEKARNLGAIKIKRGKELTWAYFKSYTEAATFFRRLTEDEPLLAVDFRHEGRAVRFRTESPPGGGK